MPKLKHITYGFDVEPKSTTRPMYKQVHGNAMIQVTQDNLALLYAAAPEADGAYTLQPQLKLSVFTADCLPILFYTDDPQGPIATVHCGWRGALQSISTSVEDLMSDYQGQINAILGPCLQQCCFEVKQDLISQFEQHGHNISAYLNNRNESVFFNMSSFVANEQLSFISPERIDTSDLRCTFCSRPELPSYRRNKSTDPRIRGWIVKNI